MLRKKIFSCNIHVQFTLFVSGPSCLLADFYLRLEFKEEAANRTVCSCVYRCIKHCQCLVMKRFNSTMALSICRKNLEAQKRPGRGDGAELGQRLVIKTKHHMH